MNDKAKILSPGISVIDLGASPGSWTQVAVQKTNSNGADKTKPKGKVLAIDKLQIFPIEVTIILFFHLGMYSKSSFLTLSLFTFSLFADQKIVNQFLD